MPLPPLLLQPEEKTTTDPNPLSSSSAAVVVLPPLPNGKSLFVPGFAVAGAREDGAVAVQVQAGCSTPGEDVACTSASASSEIFGLVLAFASFSGTLVRVVLLQQQRANGQSWPQASVSMTHSPPPCLAAP